MMTIAKPSTSSSKSSSFSNYKVGRSNDPRVVGYRHRLNWYQVPPPYEISLEEFETFALDRLHVLKAIETAQVRNIKKEDDLRQYMKEITKKYLPLSPNSGRDTSTEELRAKLFLERKKDHISHFLLRLAYCRTEDLRNWIVKMETELFRLRLLEETQEQRDRLLKQLDYLYLTPIQLSNNHNAAAITDNDSAAATNGNHSNNKKSATTNNAKEKEKQAILIRDIAYLTGLSEKDVMQQSFFKVEFEKVTELVQKRSVVVKNGFAYVPQSMQTSLVINEFRDRLQSALEATAKALPRMDDDDRLIPILNSVAKQYVNTTRQNSFLGSSSENLIHSNDVDELSDAHFPLCMRTLHRHLRQDAHLKHNARLQYGLFLKGIGLPLEEALVFWRKAFHRMNDDQFQKGGYAYNVRHNYGMEGKRANYAPYNCVKIITTNHPGAGESHGCPFRHYNQDNLRTLLTQTLTKTNGGQRSSSVSNNVNELLKMVTDGHFQVACTRLYEFTHRNQQGEKETIDTIDHPNQYFELSYTGSSHRSTKKKANNNDSEHLPLTPKQESSSSAASQMNTQSSFNSQNVVNPLTKSQENNNNNSSNVTDLSMNDDVDEFYDDPEFEALIMSEKLDGLMMSMDNESTPSPPSAVDTDNNAADNVTSTVDSASSSVSISDVPR